MLSTKDPYKWLRKLCRLAEREGLTIKDYEVDRRNIYIIGRSIVDFVKKDNIAEIIESLKDIAVEKARENLAPHFMIAGAIGTSCEMQLWFTGAKTIDIDVDYYKKGEGRATCLTIAAYVDQDDTDYEVVYKSFGKYEIQRGLTQEEIEQIEN